MAIDAYNQPSNEVMYGTEDIVSGTTVRDVSDMLDIWVHRKTPFLNYLKWGPETGASTSIEWIREHLGYGFITLGAEATTSSGGEAVLAGTDDMGGVTGAMMQLNEGAVLMGWSSESATHALMMVNCISLTGEIVYDWLLTGTVDTGSKMYLIGNFVNEASTPRADRSRNRVVMTNTLTILRKDVRISGSMSKTDMHGLAPAGELKHQMKLRLLEMQKEREMACFFSKQQDRSTTAAGFMNGIYQYFMAFESGSSAVDVTTTTLTETTFNNVMAAAWENGCYPNVVFAAQNQIRKFTEWDRQKVRMEARQELGGLHVARYLTDMGTEVDLVPIQHFPPSFMFLLDTSTITLRAKRGRKLIIEKLGKKGDFIEYEMISEFSMEAMGIGNRTVGGAFDRLT